MDKVVIIAYKLNQGMLMSKEEYEVVILCVFGLLILSLVFCVMYFIKFKNMQIRLENEINNAKENIDERMQIIDDLKKNLQKQEVLNDELQKNLAVSETNCINLQDKIDENMLQNTNLNSKISSLQDKVMELNSENLALNLSIKTKIDEINKLKESMKNDKEKLELSFKSQVENMKNFLEQGIKANFENIKNANIKELSEDSKKKFDELIKPLNDNIKEYREKMIQTDTNFKSIFENFQKEALKLGTQADALANALKGDKKMLGNLGELQLEKILDASGLVKGHNYHTQVGYKDENGNQKFLDLVVDFDSDKKAIIDAKFSLVNYSNYCESSDEKEKIIYAKKLANDLRNHINTLDSKEYKDYDTKAYPYIFMFIPYDNILRVGLTQDNNLYTYAYEKGIFITTPLTLLMALKTIYICWLNLQSDKKAENILKLAGQIYDKFVLVCEKFQTLDTRLNSLQNSKDEIHKTLSGRGGMSSYIEKLKTQGAKTTKSLPKELYDEAEILDSDL